MNRGPGFGSDVEKKSKTKSINIKKKLIQEKKKI